MAARQMSGAALNRKSRPGREKGERRERRRNRSQCLTRFWLTPRAGQDGRGRCADPERGLVREGPVPSRQPRNPARIDPAECRRVSPPAARERLAGPPGRRHRKPPSTAPNVTRPRPSGACPGEPRMSEHQRRAPTRAHPPICAVSRPGPRGLRADAPRRAPRGPGRNARRIPAARSRRVPSGIHPQNGAARVGHEQQSGIARPSTDRLAPARDRRKRRTAPITRRTPREATEDERREARSKETKEGGLEVRRERAEPVEGVAVEHLAARQRVGVDPFGTRVDDRVRPFPARNDPEDSRREHCRREESRPGQAARGRSRHAGPPLPAEESRSRTSMMRRSPNLPTTEKAAAGTRRARAAAVSSSRPRRIIQNRCPAARR